MKTYYKFILSVYFKSFIYVFLVMFSLVIILNILTELEFFRNIDVKFYFPIYISILNSPSLIFEMFPFIFLIGTQLFFISLFNDNQIQIFKYSGLENSRSIERMTEFKPPTSGTTNQHSNQLSYKHIFEVMLLHS